MTFHYQQRAVASMYRWAEKNCVFDKNMHLIITTPDGDWIGCLMAKQEPKAKPHFQRGWIIERVTSKEDCMTGMLDDLVGKTLADTMLTLASWGVRIERDTNLCNETWGGVLNRKN